MNNETQSDKIARLFVENTHLKKLLGQSKDLIWLLGRDIKSVTFPNNKRIELSDFFEKLQRAISKGEKQRTRGNLFLRWNDEGNNYRRN